MLSAATCDGGVGPLPIIGGAGAADVHDRSARAGRLSAWREGMGVITGIAVDMSLCVAHS